MPIFLYLSVMVVDGDYNLLERIREGSHQALEIIFLEYYSKLCAYANSILSDKAASEDIVQGLFVKLWDNRKNLDVRVSLRSYLYRTTHNLCLNYLESKKVRMNYAKNADQSAEPPLPFAGDYPIANLILKETDEKIREAIRSLPDRYRKVFMMIRFYDNSYQEVAEKLNISVNTVKTMMQRSLTRLRSLLSPYFPE